MAFMCCKRGERLKRDSRRFFLYHLFQDKFDLTNVTSKAAGEEIFVRLCIYHPI
jgi:hypothetical protein